LSNLGADRSPITFASPNLAELKHIYQAANSDELALTSHPSWWSVIDDFSLGPEFRSDLERLARQNVSDEGSSKGTLSFLVDDGIAQMVINLLPFVQNLIVKCGERGVLVGIRISGQDIQASPWSRTTGRPIHRFVVARGKSSKEMVVLQHFAPPIVENLVSVTGAGDTFVGILLANLIQDPETFLHPERLKKALVAAQHGAALTLQSASAVSPLLSH
jgi:pseudouridylate synthase / pseudouridine kinase